MTADKKTKTPVPPMVQKARAEFSGSLGEAVERGITEKKADENKLRRMATIIQDSNDAISLQDLNGNITAWNRGAEKIYGYTEAEALRMNITALVPEAFQEETRNFIAHLRQGRILPSLETKRKTKDGRILDVWLTTTALTDELGKLSGVATTERDITERKQADASIRAKALELEMMRNGQMALSDRMRGEQDIASLGRNVLAHLAPFLGAQMAAFYEVTEAGTLRRVAGYAYTKPHSRETTIEFGEGLVGQAALEKKPLYIEHVPSHYFQKIRSDSGESAPGSLLLVPVSYEGKIKAVIELASFGSFAEHQRTFVEHMSENIGIAINTADSRKRLQELLETSQVLNEELQTQQEELRVANEELEEQSCALKESQTKLENQQAELEQTNEQLEEQTQALEQQRDLLNQKNDALEKAQELLEARSTEVQKASQYKSEFLANMSHELRTPLNSSLILAKLLSENSAGNLTESQVQYAESICSSNNDLLDLINDILDLSKVEAGKLDIRPENVYLPQVLGLLEKTFSPLAEKKQIGFSLRIDPEMAETIFTDRQRLDQVLKNLLSNAFKFTEKGAVDVHVSNHPEGLVAFAVTDSGIGIAQDQQQVIFEAFRQADGTTNRKYGGTGLGLSISRDLARLLGGSVEVVSTAGTGSTFTLLLPAMYDESKIDSAPSKSYSTSAPTAPSVKIEELALLEPKKRRSHTPPVPDDRALNDSSGYTLLVIEDEAQFSKILYDIAHELSFRCLIAQNAEEGLEMAHAFLPDAILLDMKLPDKSGMAVLEQLKERSETRHIPVHVVSATDYTSQAGQMGAIGYMLKPAKRDELKSVFLKFEAKLAQKIKRVLVVEDDALQRESVVKLIQEPDVEITAVELGQEALNALKNTVFDCVVMDLKLPDMSGETLLEHMAREEMSSFPPVIVYTGRDLTRDEEDRLRKHSQSIIIKGARSPERLVDEVTLFLHQVESKLSPERRQMLKTVRNREKTFEGRKILVVDDDVRNIFAMSAALEHQGSIIEIARNGKEALAKLENDPRTDLVLMDIMMPEMNGFEAIKLIRKQKRFEKLPIIAVTAKATNEDQALCLEAGADDYLAKPIELDQLFSLIRVWMPKLRKA